MYPGSFFIGGGEAFGRGNSSRSRLVGIGIGGVGPPEAPDARCGPERGEPNARAQEIAQGRNRSC